MYSQSTTYYKYIFWLTGILFFYSVTIPKQQNVQEVIIDPH